MLPNTTLKPTEPEGQLFVGVSSFHGLLDEDGVNYLNLMAEKVCLKS